VGRWVLAWYFLANAWGLANDWHGTLKSFIDHQVPVPQLLLVLALILMILGSLSLLLGYHVRTGALALFAFLVLATLALHDYWHIADPDKRAAEYELFARNIAILGGLLLLIGMGSGPFGFDNRMTQKKRR
jgi:putative oxidoreductase